MGLEQLLEGRMGGPTFPTLPTWPSLIYIHSKLDLDLSGTQGDERVASGLLACWSGPFLCSVIVRDPFPRALQSNKAG